MSKAINNIEKKISFLECRPGRFSLFVDDFTEGELKNTRPVVLFQTGLDRIGIKRSEINYKKDFSSFHHWLRRHRKKKEAVKERGFLKEHQKGKFRFTDPTETDSKEEIIKFVE